MWSGRGLRPAWTIRSAAARRGTHASSAPSAVDTPPLIDWSRAAASLPRDSVRLVPDVISPEEERRLVAELEKPLRRRRLMQNHWDSVIEHYRELERRAWEDPENARTVARVRSQVLGLLGLAPETPCLPVHVIDLAAEGFIKPHVDSVKFSGGFVAGLSLLSPAIMRLRDEQGGEDNSAAASAASASDSPSYSSSMVRMLLEPRSLYVLSGAARFHYAHEILPDEKDWVGGRVVRRERRISLIFRDELLPSPAS